MAVKGRFTYRYHFTGSLLIPNYTNYTNIPIILISLYRFDFVLNANQKPKHENKRGRSGIKYKHNDGVYKIRLQGLQACEFGGVIGEALLVYSSPTSTLHDSEVELAAFFEHSRIRPHKSRTYETVSAIIAST